MFQLESSQIQSWKDIFSWILDLLSHLENFKQVNVFLKSSQGFYVYFAKK